MKYLFPVFILVLFSSCFSEGDCLVTATNQMYIQLKKKSATTTDTLINFKFIRVSGTDSIFKFASSTASLLLPLDVKRDTTSYVFYRRNPLDTSQLLPPDTFNVSYKRATKVLGKDCGAYLFYQNLNAVKISKSFSVKLYNNFLIKNPSNQQYALNYQLFF
ncbi:MAG: hypothetical protein JST74_06555 [Bacteroidetes bacterium]|nr:hypothetical protein [Bacteroidota bacterium]